MTYYLATTNQQQNPASNNNNNDNGYYHSRSAITRNQTNIEILRSIKNGDFSNAKNYSAFGGLRRLIGSQSEQQTLLQFLSRDEIKALLANTSSGYYTPDFLIDYLFKIVQQLGFTHGDILEPSCGRGAFFERMPKDMRENSNITGVEIEPLSAKIAQNFYSDILVLNSGFQDFNQANFDLVIGNPPFASFGVDDKNHQDLKNQGVHHYFVAKSLRLLKEGGLLAMVLPCYVLDNYKNHARNEMMKEADLLCAYRLPDSLFDDAKVTVDLVIFRKRDLKQKNNNDQQLSNLPTWFHSKKIKFDNGIETFMSEYFINHPEHVIGDIQSYSKWMPSQNRNRTGLKCVGNLDLVNAKLPSLINHLKPIVSNADNQKVKTKKDDTKVISITRGSSDSKINQAFSDLMVMLKNVESQLQSIQQVVDCFE